VTKLRQVSSHDKRSDIGLLMARFRQVAPHDMVYTSGSSWQGLDKRLFMTRFRQVAPHDMVETSG